MEPQPESNPELTEAERSFVESITDKPPYVSGTLPLPLDMFNLWYGNGADSRHVNLAQASPKELLALATACQPATFGRGAEDVLDEAYRKAGKMDANVFSTPLVPERTDLINIVRGYLLEGTESNRPIEVELYKLNVYGEGSFFKAHVDTPRNESMFGSLVLVFPTQHKGGDLVFRHAGNEWTFDSAQAVGDQDSPSIAFASFFSDVEHEVLPVTSGQRVTLTYNLYFGDMKKKEDKEEGPATSSPTLMAIPHSLASNGATICSTFEALLTMPSFLPDGGAIGFGLHHVYPFSESISHVPQLLKGSDAVLWRVFSTLGFEPTIYLFYKRERMWGSGADKTLMDKPVDFNYMEERSFAGYVHKHGGIMVYQRYGRPDEEVKWMTKANNSLNRHTREYVAYGNESHLSYAYGDMCMIVRVGKAGERTTYPSADEVRAKMVAQGGTRAWN
ncbi:hypothetical protein OF83DRAFT_1059009 [Amylostereum chailletii]|nr:hypothetical protein OF83DRAFT_1059009 [Amylostereum chailletii]